MAVAALGIHAENAAGYVVSTGHYSIHPRIKNNAMDGLYLGVGGVGVWCVCVCACGGRGFWKALRVEGRGLVLEAGGGAEIFGLPFLSHS